MADNIVWYDGNQNRARDDITQFSLERNLSNGQANPELRYPM